MLLSILLFQMLAAAMAGAIIQNNHGNWAYPAGGAYTALDVSRKLVETGALTLETPGPPPLYTALLAAIFRVSGWHEYVPLVVNLTAAAGVLGAAASVLAQLGAGPWRTLLALLALVVATPLPAIALSGMEHTLQIFATLLFVRAFLAGSRLLPLAAMAMTGLQFENIGLAAIACAILAHGGEWTRAFRTLACACVVPGAIAIASLTGGLPLVPVPVQIESAIRQPGYWNRLGEASHGVTASHLIETAQLSVLLAVILTALPAGWRNRPAVSGAAVGAIGVHAVFGGESWLFLSEAYLVVLGIIAVAALPKIRVAALVLLAIPFGWRAERAITTTVGAAAQVYHRQTERRTAAIPRENRTNRSPF